MKVLGLDSSTKTGLCMLDGDESRVTVLTIPEIDGYERLQLIAANLRRIVTAWQPDIVYIENYGLGMAKSATTIITQVEIGTTQRQVLADAGIPWRLIKPNTLKLFVGGPGFGNMKKPVMMAKIAERWGFTHKSDDVCDAYALARMGQHLLAIPVEKYPKGVEYGYGALPSKVLEV